MPAAKSSKAKKTRKSTASSSRPGRKAPTRKKASSSKATTKKKGTVTRKNVTTSPKSTKKIKKKTKRPAPSPPSPYLGMSRGYVKALGEYEKAMASFHRREFDKATALFQKIIDLYADDADELADRARVYLATCRKQTEEESRPQGFEEHYNQGVYHSNRGEHAEAIEVLNKALKLEAESAKAHYAIAAAFAQRGDVEAAIEHLRRAIAADPANLLLAKRDGDLEPLRGNPEFEDLIDATAQASA